MTVTRKTQREDVLYVTPRYSEGKDSCVFYTPDGEGRFYFDTIETAMDETGITKVVRLSGEPKDH